MSPADGEVTVKVSSNVIVAEPSFDRSRLFPVTRRAGRLRSSEAPSSQPAATGDRTLSSANSMPFASEIVPPTLTVTVVACVLPMFDWLLLTVKVGASPSLTKL